MTINDIYAPPGEPDGNEMVFIMEIYSDRDGWKEHGRYNSAKAMFDDWLSIFESRWDLDSDIYHWDPDTDSYYFYWLSGEYAIPITLYHWGRTFTGWREQFGRHRSIEIRRGD